MVNFFIEDGILDPATIRSRGFAARIFPEFPSEEEIALIADQIGAGELEFWAHEFGQPPRHFASQPAGLMLGALFENSPYSLLISFSGRNMFIWAPEDHEYLVVFGEPELVTLVEQSAIFNYGFSDHLASGDLSESTIENLRAAAASYTFG